jgi:hypothetical protein
MQADADARRSFADLPAELQVTFTHEIHGETAAIREIEWDTSVRYVTYNSTWYSTMVACP